MATANTHDEAARENCPWCDTELKLATISDADADEIYEVGQYCPAQDCTWVFPDQSDLY